MQMAGRRIIACLVLLAGAGAGPASAATSAKQLYQTAMARERALRTAWTDDTHAAPESTAAAPAGPLPAATLRQARAIVAAYEAIVLRYPVSGYCDNALWQGAELAADLFAKSQQVSDRRTAIRLFQFLARDTRPARWQHGPPTSHAGFRLRRRPTCRTRRDVPSRQTRAAGSCRMRQLPDERKAPRRRRREAPGRLRLATLSHRTRRLPPRAPLLPARFLPCPRSVTFGAACWRKSFASRSNSIAKSSFTRSASRIRRACSSTCPPRRRPRRCRTRAGTTRTTSCAISGSAGIRTRRHVSCSISTASVATPS